MKDKLVDGLKPVEIRGLTRGSVFTRDGTLVATVAQEGLVRQKATSFKLS